MNTLGPNATSTDLLMANVWRAPEGYVVLARHSHPPASSGWTRVGSISDLTRAYRDRGERWFSVRYPLPAWLTAAIKRRSDQLTAAAAQIDTAAEEARLEAAAAALDAEAPK